jgi:hypothetical protein
MLLKNRQLFSWGFCWSCGACSPEISAFMVFKTQNGLVNALSDRKKKFWFESYSVPKFKTFQNQVVWGHNYNFILILHSRFESDLPATFRKA